MSENMHEVQVHEGGRQPVWRRHWKPPHTQSKSCCQNVWKGPWMALTGLLNGKRHQQKGKSGAMLFREPLHLHYNELSRNPLSTLTKNIPSERGRGANGQPGVKSFPPRRRGLVLSSERNQSKERGHFSGPPSPLRTRPAQT